MSMFVLLENLMTARQDLGKLSNYRQFYCQLSKHILSVR